MEKSSLATFIQIMLIALSLELRVTVAPAPMPRVSHGWLPLIKAKGFMFPSPRRHRQRGLRGLLLGLPPSLCLERKRRRISPSRGIDLTPPAVDILLARLSEDEQFTLTVKVSINTIQKSELPRCQASFTTVRWVLSLCLLILFSALWIICFKHHHSNVYVPVNFVAELLPGETSRMARIIEEAMEALAPISEGPIAENTTEAPCLNIRDASRHGCGGPFSCVGCGYREGT